MCTPQGPDPSLPTEPLIDLKSGYVERAMDRLPKQGPSLPWRLHQNYFRDVRLLKRGPVDDSMTFARPTELAGAKAKSSGRTALAA
jgi:monooxygenase